MGASLVVEAVKAIGPAGAVELTSPRPGSAGGAALEVAGSTPRPRLTTIEVGRGRVLAEIPVVDRRFSGAVDLTGLESRVRLRVRARFADDTRRDIAVITVSRSLTPADDPGGLQPLAVTSMGRSGSTYLMHLLLAHPAVAGHDAYPYEGRWMAYALALRRLLVEAPTTLGHHRPARIPWGPGAAVTPGLPETETTTAAREHAADVMARTMIRRAFPETASYLAEKGAPIAELRELFAAPAEIILVRDPRDIFASILAFNRKRGFDDFGRQTVDTDESFVEVFTERAARFAQMLERRAPGAIVVRYEDLVEQPGPVWETVTAGLDIASSGVPDSAALDAHRTSSDGSASVGKWRRELDVRLAERLDAALRDVIGALGYA
jgi:hypothetical protein